MNPATSAHLRGRDYENAVAEILNQKGYNVSIHDQTTNRDHDLIVNGIIVEVKGAIPHPFCGKSQYLGYQFAIRRADNSHNDVLEFDCLILYCAIKTQDMFIIPNGDIYFTKSITIPHTRPCAYKGKWATYYMRFDLLDSIIESKRKENEKANA